MRLITDCGFGPSHSTSSLKDGDLFVILGVSPHNPTEDHGNPLVDIWNFRSSAVRTFHIIHLKQISTEVGRG